VEIKNVYKGIRKKKNEDKGKVGRKKGEMYSNWGHIKGKRALEEYRKYWRCARVGLFSVGEEVNMVCTTKQFLVMRLSPLCQGAR
jgi:hypothetical protein